MKKNSKYLFTSIVFLIAGCLPNEHNEDKSFLVNSKSMHAENLHQIDSIIQLQLKEWNQGSVQGFMKGYWQNDSLRFITKNGVMTGWNKVLSMYQKGYPTHEKMGNLSFEIYETRFLDDDFSIANVIGMYRVDKTINHLQTRDSGVFSLIFKQVENQNWKIIQDHTF